MLQAMKRLLKTPFSMLGFEIYRRSTAPVETRVPRNTLEGALKNVASIGWQPTCVIDVGAAYGSFAQTCAKVFPDAFYLLAEPLQEYATRLQSVARGLRGIYAPVAAGKADGKAAMYVHGDWVGSSMYHEAEGAHVDGQERVVPVRALDSLCAEHQLSGPFLLKADVQGAELDVIAGADQILGEVEVIILEVSFFQFFLEGPQFYDVVARMKELGFVVYDIFGLQDRLLDHALSQADLMFVQENGHLRSQHVYATPDQRIQQDLALEVERNNLMMEQ